MNKSMRVNENPEVWYKRKAGLIVLALLSGALICVPMGLYLNLRMSQTRALTRFTCYPTLGNNNGTFTISVDVNLTNGMSQNEAVLVAETVLNKLVLEKNTEEQLLNLKVSATVGDNGIWSVRFDWDVQRIGYFPGAHPYGPKYMIMIHEYFEATVDPSRQTVVYG
jgi:hypothetical protein